METKIIKIDSERPEREKIMEAANLIRKGELVAFPTETVYGLGANTLDEKAVEKIFIAKGRPQDNPLIIHISDKMDLDKYVQFVPKKAKKLIDKYWPGPLTIILRKKAIIPLVVTAGLDSVAVRMPSEKIALKLIKEAGVPLAAPSANISGKPSPTCFFHVFEDMDGKIAAIIYGDDCSVGLESSVISFVSEIPVLLRPGKITREDIESLIGPIEVSPAVININSKIKAISPGMKYKHYGPNARVITVIGKESREKIKELKKSYLELGKIVEQIIFDGNLEDYGKNLFKKFREFDKDNVDIVLVEGVVEEGLGMAIMNRLKRASSEIIYM